MVLHPVFSFPVMKIRIDRLIWHGCEYGKQQFTKLQRRFSNGCKNPYRCAECGSKDILCRAWLDSNTYEADSLPDDSEDLWCEACAEHTDQVRESELMSGTVEPWWRDGTTEEDRAIITGLNPENFSSRMIAGLSATPATCGGVARRTTRRSASGTPAARL